MNPTPEQLDAVLGFLSNQDQMIEYEVLQNNIDVPANLLLSICPILDYDGYIDAGWVEEKPYPVKIGLKKKGLKFFTIGGGYTEERRKENLAENQIESVIKTNRLQRWSFWASLITALAALAVSLVSLLKNDSHIINPSIILKDTVLNLSHKDTLQLQIQLHQSNDTSARHK